MMKIACDEVATERTPLPYRGSWEALPYEGQIIPVYQSIKYERREVSAELYLVIPAVTAMGQIWRSLVGDRVPLQHRGSRDRATIKSLSVGQGSAPLVRPGNLWLVLCCRDSDLCYRDSGIGCMVPQCCIVSRQLDLLHHDSGVSSNLRLWWCKNIDDIPIFAVLQIVF